MALCTVKLPLKIANLRLKNQTALLAAVVAGTGALGKAIGLTAMVAFSALAQPHFVPLPSFAYEKGFVPSVAISGTSVVEVHQGSYGVGSLWYRSARIQADGTVICSPQAIQYDN